MFCNYGSPKKFILCLLSGFSLFMGIVLILFHQKLFQIIVKSQLRIEPGTAAYDAWKESNIPLYTKFYFFDMINPSELFYSHEKPILFERGPYTFRESQRKVAIESHSDGTVSYGREKVWYFEPSLSVGSLNDTITTINVPVVGSAEFVRGDFFLEWGISDMLSSLQARIFIKRTVGELLFEGYKDAVMEMGNQFKGEEKEPDKEEESDYFIDLHSFDEEDVMDSLDYLESFFDEEEDSESEESDNTKFYSDFNVKKDEDATHQNPDYVLNDPTEIPDRFGWFYQRNGTSWSDGVIRMHTGKGDIERLGEIISWNEEKMTSAYTGECGKVRGSAEGLFPPGYADLNSKLTLYSTDLCRSLDFEKEEGKNEHSVHGISIQKFLLSPSNFANSSVCPSNACYNNNLPTGVQNVTMCKMKSPAFVSRPHFYLADPSYIQAFQFGMNPQEELHDSSFWIEPRSSIPLKVQMRLQLNVLLDKVEGIEYLFKDLQKVMFPVFWFDSSMELPVEMSASLHLLVMLPDLMAGCGYFCVVVSTLIVVFMACSKLKSSKSYRPSPASCDSFSPIIKEKEPLQRPCLAPVYEHDDNFDSSLPILDKSGECSFRILQEHHSRYPDKAGGRDRHNSVYF